MKSLRQTQTPTVVATPQLLTCLQCQIKELVPPRLLSARQTPSFLSRRHTQRNRSTRTRAGTQPTAHKQRKEASKLFQCGYCFKCPRVTLQFSSLRNTRHHSLEPMSQLGNSIPGFQYTTFLQRLLKQFQTAMMYKSPSHKNVRNISNSSQVKLVLVQTQVTS